MIWSYFAEFQPKSKRGAMLSFMAAFWTLGNLFVAGLAWVIIPSGQYFCNYSIASNEALAPCRTKQVFRFSPHFRICKTIDCKKNLAIERIVTPYYLVRFNHNGEFLSDAGIGGETGGFVYNSWRIFLLVMSLPSFVVAALLFLLPESPKFLITTGRHDEALEVFRGIYMMNTGRDKELYPVKQILVDEPLHHKTEKPDKPEKVEPKKPKSKLRKMMGDIIEHSKELFVPPILKFTAISITINFTFHIG